MFAYCNNDPVNAADPAGYVLCSILDEPGMLGGGGRSEPEPKTASETVSEITDAPDDFRNYNDNFSIDHNNCYSYAFDLPYTQNPGYTIKGFFRRVLKPIIHIAYGSTSPSESATGMAVLVLIDMKNENKHCRIIRSPSDARMDEYVVAMKTTDYIEAQSRVDYHFAVLLSDGTWADKMGNGPVRRNVINGYDNSWPYSNTNSYCSPTVFFALGG